MASATERPLRLFVALELPGAVAARLAAWGEEVAGARDGLRAVRPEAVHVTLAFLGARPEREVERIADALPAGAPPRLAVAGATWLGGRPPRVLALDLHDEDGRCAALAGAAAGALEALGVFRGEQRRFRPHVTVARVRRGTRVERRLPDPPAVEPFLAPAVALMRSHPGPGGARYERLARVELG